MYQGNPLVVDEQDASFAIVPPLVPRVVRPPRLKPRQRHSTLSSTSPRPLSPILSLRRTLLHPLVTAHHPVHRKCPYPQTRQTRLIFLPEEEFLHPTPINSRRRLFGRTLIRQA